eukprot:3235601-Rhodomonas_salina.3
MPAQLQLRGILSWAEHLDTVQIASRRRDRSLAVTSQPKRVTSQVILRDAKEEETHQRRLCGWSGHHGAVPSALPSMRSRPQDPAP